MKSVAFLRKTWKKLEKKTPFNQEPSSKDVGNTVEDQGNTLHPWSSTRSLSVTVNHSYANLSSSPAPKSKASWKQTQPLSAGYEKSSFPRHAGTSATLERDPFFSQDLSKNAPWRDKALPEIRNCNLSLSSSPRSLILQPFRLDPSMDFDNRPSDDFEQHFQSKISPRSSSPKSFPEGQKSTASSRSDRLHSKKVHAVLDLTIEAKPKTLYHTTGSTPHLPYKANALTTHYHSSNSASSCSEGSAENFPLSLFPVPPPLKVRKKVPTPLVLHTMSPASTPSSRDSTPIGTPTTPHFQPSLRSPSQASISSTIKKFYLGRSLANIPPPPFSPPNSPLPQLPMSVSQKVRDPVVRPLRTASSNVNLREVLPFSATHRLTSSEPISDQSSSSLPIKSSTKPRPEGERAKIDIQGDHARQSTSSNVEARIEWGYAY